jgi:hypothetical protein
MTIFARDYPVIMLSAISYLLHTPQVLPSFAHRLQYLQFLQALQGLAPTQVATALRDFAIGSEL